VVVGRRLTGVLTAAQLERTLRAYRRLTVVEAREQQANAFLNLFWNPDGSLELHGRLAPEDGGVVVRALEAQRDDLDDALYGLLVIQRRAAKSRGDPD